MQIFPAIDLRHGNCVRLTQGDFNQATVYDSDPVNMAKSFANAGVQWMHVVDLDGAKEGTMQQFNLIADIAKSVPLKIQVGGGIRDEQTIQNLLNAGIARVVIGSLAVKNPDLVKGWLKKFGGDKIVLAFDIKIDDKNEPEILTHGWQSGSRQSLWDLLKLFQGSDLKTILCTDIGRDGMMNGPNVILYRSIQQHHPELEILASGGIGELGDLMDLARLGIAGAITGKAIYEGKIKLDEALQQVKSAG